MRENFGFLVSVMVILFITSLCFAEQKFVTIPKGSEVEKLGP